MSKSLKRIALGVWILLLVAVIVDFVNRWLGENYFSDPNIIIVFNLAASIVQQRWFQFGLVFLTGIVVGISLDWFDRKSRENKASELRTLGSKFRILSDAINADMFVCDVGEGPCGSKVGAIAVLCGMWRRVSQF